MGKKLLIDATHAEETRVVVLDGNKVEDFDFETIHKRQLAGNIYLAKVTRVEPSLQAAFVDYGGNRHGFLAFAEIHPDYYQIPVADRQALLAEERALARDQDDDDARPARNDRRSRRRAPQAAEAVEAVDAVAGTEAETQEPEGASQPEAEGDAPPSPAETPAAPAPTETPAVRAEDAGLAPARIAAGMDIVELDDASDPLDDSADPRSDGNDEPAQADGAGDEPEPYRAADHATELDDQIESVADEDVSDEVRPPRRPRARRYKIQEVIKVRQIMLVQVVKEERGNKGAALTTYLSLAGRYCVLMPNTGRGGGISRKITNAADRKKLKEIAAEMEVPEGAGLIIRTAGAQRTKPEIKRDYEYLFRLWEQIRDLTLKSIAPAPIYEEGDLIKRSIRDLHSKDIDEVLVEGEAGYRTARDFMQMIMPSQVAQVKHYTEAMPLFARHQVESYLAGMFNPTVQLKSGGYIVIGVTEALVAIDINSGKATRQGSIEETALQTNLEAADEIARQLRLRDLAGLIVIDFIDMEERRNNAAVEKRLKDALRNDRARIQVGRISGFGLLEMSRQRLRPGMLEATTQPCPHCHGTGLIRSDNSIALAILRALEEEGVRKRSREVLLRAPVGVVNYLFNNKREHLAQIEARYGMAIRLEGDPALISPDYSLEKFKTATRLVRALTPVVSLDAQTMSGVDEDMGVEDAPEAVAEVVTEAAPAAAPASDDTGDGEGGRDGRRKRRRRRRRRNGEAGGPDDTGSDDTGSDDTGSDDTGVDTAAQESDDSGSDDEGARDDGQAVAPSVPTDQPAAAEASEAPEAPEPAAEKPARRRRTRTPKAEPAPASADGAALADPVAEKAPAATPEPEAAPKPRRSRRKPKAEPQPEAAAAESPEPEAAPAAAEPAVAGPPVPETVPETVPVATASDAAPQVGADSDTAEPAATEPAPAVNQADAELAPDTPAPDTPAPERVAPETVAPDTKVPETPVARTPEEADANAAAGASAEPAPDRPRRVGWWARKG